MKRTAAVLLAAALLRVPAWGGFLPGGAFTDDARGLCGAQFLKVPPSARFAALGGAGLTLESRDSFFLNPAAAAAFPAAAAASYEALLEGSSRTGLVFSRGTRAGVFSTGLVYQDSSSGLDRLDGAGTALGGGIAAYDVAAGGGWARRTAWGAFGFNAKYVRSRLAEASGATAALDAGLLFRDPSKPATELAIAARNFGPPLRLGSLRAPLPAELAGGLRWKYASDFHILAEGRMPADHAPYLLFAGEWFIRSSPSSGLFLRSGLNFKNYSEHGFMGTFAGGFGLKVGEFTADYAFSPYGELGAAHRMTLGLAWGQRPSAAAPRAAALPAKALVAVAPFYRGDGVTELEASVVRNLAESELAKTGRFTAVDRTRLDFVLAEKKAAYSGASPEAAAWELAKASGAELGVFGIVTRDGEGYLVTIGLAGPDGRLAAQTERAEEDYLFRDASRRAAAALAAR